MTEREAIERIKDHMRIHFQEEYPRAIKITEALEIAIQALEKQIVGIPNIEGDGYADGVLVYDIWYCPNCEKEYEIDYDDYNYCPNCGKHIKKIWEDWSEE